MRLYSVAASWTCFLDCSVALCSVVSSRPQSKAMWELEGYIAEVYIEKKGLRNTLFKGHSGREGRKSEGNHRRKGSTNNMAV